MFSKRSLKLEPSPLQTFFGKVKALEAQGISVISLGVGESSAHCPKRVAVLVSEALSDGKVGKYVPAIGSIGLRSAIAGRYGVKVEDVFASNGAKNVLGAILHCLVDPGDQILIPAPYYPPFVQMVNFLEGIPVILETGAADFQLTSEMVEHQIKAQGLKPKLMIINSPNNPTGAVYVQEELQKIVALSEKYGFRIISDECYSNFSSDPHFTLRRFSEQVIVVNSVSKSYSMEGWRVGWAIGDAELTRMADLYLQNFSGCPSSVSERGAMAAFGGAASADCQRQREIVFAWLRERSIPWSGGTGAFYVFPDMTETIQRLGLKNGVQLAEWLLEKARVAVTPGSAFGEKYSQHIRVSFPIDEEKLREALERISAVI